jgi:glycosyltransferase involved in cell wall biosynthesis
LQGGANEATDRAPVVAGRHDLSIPLVSVVMPTFNRLRFLRPAIDSVYAQTFGNWELIIADDGSDSETRQFLQSLTNHPHIKVVWLSHTGSLAITRNATLREAGGEYVAFMDSDDLWAPLKLERQIAALRARINCHWSYTAFVQVDASGKPLPDEAQRRWIPCQGDIFEQVVTGNASIRTPSVVAARELIGRAGGFDEAMLSATDYDLWLRLALYSEVALIDEPLVYVRRHDEHHSRQYWQSAFVGRDRSLRRCQQLVGSGRRSLLREERMRNALRLVALHSERGTGVSTLRAFCQSLPYSWPYARWWLGGLKTMLRPYLPRRLLEFYRERWRGA